MPPGVRFVLVRPGSGGNIGASARAIKNMGFAELWLVEPRAFDTVEAERMAHGATDVLQSAHRTATLAEALLGCRWTVGATRRLGRRRPVTWSPRELARAVYAEPGRRPLALVFGPEEDGLDMADLALCDHIVRIPAAAAQPSLNLAQAVLVVAYELFVAAPGDAPGANAGVEMSPDATAEQMERLYAHLESVLLEVGFVRPDTAPARMLAVRHVLGRVRLRAGDVRLLRGICRQVQWALRQRSV
jgi:tRNA/rRNA methyltransferase